MKIFKMKHSVALLAAIAVPFSLVAQNANWISEDADAVFAYDVKAVKKIAVKPSDSVCDTAIQKCKADIAKYGIDYDKDVEIFFGYVVAQDNDKPRVIGFVKGTFDTTKVEAILSADKTVKISSAGKYKMYKVEPPAGYNAEKRQTAYVAFPANGAIAISDSEQHLSDALNVVSGQAKAIKSDSKFAKTLAATAPIRACADVHDLFGVTEFKSANGLNIPMPSSVYVSVKEKNPETAVFAAIGNFANEADANAAQQQLNGFKTMFAMLGAQNPQAGGITTEILPNLQIGSKGNNVSITLDITQKMLDSIKTLTSSKQNSSASPALLPF